MIGPAISRIKAIAAQLAADLQKLKAAKKIVDDYLSAAYRAGMTADALLKSYTSSPAFATDQRLVFSDMTNYPALGYARQRCYEICALGGNPSRDG